MTSLFEQWINEESTILVRQWKSGRMEVSLRDHPDAIWGPAVPVIPEQLA